MHPPASLFSGRMSKHIRRILPFYVAFVFLILFFSRADPLELNQSPSDVLKRVIAYQTRSSTNRIPKKVWQTWKVDPLHMEDRDSSRARSWTELNVGWRYEALTDGNDLEYVETHFGPNGVLNRPDIVHAYRTLTAMIIKADLLRYLVMYVEGGVYADIDVEALKPADTWIPSHIPQEEVGLVISVEIDEPNFVNHTILGPKSQSFCQWTFMCKPKQPVILKLIDNVLRWLDEISAKQGVPISNITLNFDEVLTGTGPSAFTSAMLAEMRAQTRRPVAWDQFHALEAPKLVGNILVLTVEAFAAGQGHSNSHNHDHEFALVKHHYHASLWPSRHPRYSHPAYGMVEECNWNADCVSGWTYNTSVYDALSDDEKRRLIEQKKLADAERFNKEETEKMDKEREETDRRREELRTSCEAASFIPKATPTPEAQATETSNGDQAEAAQTNPAEHAQPTEPAHADAKRDSISIWEQILDQR